jgi:hypothetical protein
LKKEKKRYMRDGVDTLSEVSAFLGGIFFTGLLLLVQQQGNLENTELYLIAVPLSISIVLFVFSSIFFAFACSNADDDKFNKMADDVSTLFLLGFTSMFVSLFALLLLVHTVIGILGIALSGLVLFWWIRRRNR